MSSRFETRILTTAITAALTIGIACMQVAYAQAVTPPSVPAELQPPDGNTPYLKVHAVGTQNYMCVSSPGGFAWTFYGPDATLFVTIKWFNGDLQQQVGTHFLSPNPTENGTARPAWQSSFDTSKVWGRQTAMSTNPAYVAPGAIPWLLLQVAGSQAGPAGGATVTHTTFIQRVNTAGGIAPSTGCATVDNIGAKALVPYTADYVLYRASRER